MNYKIPSVFLIVLLFFQCSNKNAINISQDLSNTDFVYLKDKHFFIREDKFFPIMLNYCISFRNINGDFVISPDVNYEIVGKFEYNTKAETHDQLRTHFRLIKSLGFNSIRLTFDRCNLTNGKYYYSDFCIDDSVNVILTELDSLVNIAGENSLRVMLLIKPPLNNSLVLFTEKVLDHFKDNSAIFAYDFFNEPLYFDDDPNRSKIAAYNIQLNWKKMMLKHAPNQMITIGFSEPIEVFEWDPSISPVDFICFHTYHPLRVKNEIYWYCKYSNKPCMIGETALPADNDSISYTDQANFAKGVFEYAIDCGAVGIGWWDFQDMAVNGNFEALFSGILNHEGITYTYDGEKPIIGTPKPVAKEFKLLANYSSQNKLLQPVNFFNNLGYNNFVIMGRIVNRSTGYPIEGAVVRGWTNNWKIAWNTYTDSYGFFTLYSNDVYSHFEVSAPGMTKIKFDRTLDFNSINNDSAYICGNLPLQFLEYHKVDYTNYLKDFASSVFDFDEELFIHAKFQSNMGTLFLSPLSLKH